MPVYDFICTDCRAVAEDVRFRLAEFPPEVRHWDCGGQDHGRMEVLYRPRHGPAQWSPNDRVVLFRNREGRIMTPGRTDHPTPAGYERIEMASLAEVTRHERSSGSIVMGMHFDRNGRDVDYAVRHMTAPPKE
jgi:hypothetical protein